MTSRTALVVDDSKSARFALRRCLESSGFKAETAESAEECYRALKQHRPQVIFLDHVMPGTDGFAALRHLKSQAATASIPVVICSSNEGADFVQQARDGGAVAVLQKPPSAEQLARVLRRVERESAAPRTASKVANIREPEVAIEQQVMKTLRNSLAAPASSAPVLLPLHEVTQSLTAQVAELQHQAAQLNSRIGQEPPADQRKLMATLAAQQKRIDTLEQLVESRFAELHAALEAGLRTQSERIKQVSETARAAAAKTAHDEAERTVMNAAARISDQLASSIINALRATAFNFLAPHSPAESSPPETTGRRKA